MNETSSLRVVCALASPPIAIVEPLAAIELGANLGF